MSPAPAPPVTALPATILLMAICSESLILDGCCSDVDEVLDTLLATPLVAGPVVIILVLVVMANVLLVGSEALPDIA